MIYKNCSKCKIQQIQSEFNKNSKTKDRLNSWCKSCCKNKYKESYTKNKSKWLARSVAWKKNNPQKTKEIYAKWKKANKIKANELERKRYCRLRLKALEIIGKLHCSNCGCNRYDFLEINHINGNGYQERKTTQTAKFYSNIINGKRSTEDLNILCKPCNVLHYLELVHGTLPYKVVWDEKLVSGHETKKQ